MNTRPLFLFFFLVSFVCCHQIIEEQRSFLGNTIRENWKVGNIHESRESLKNNQQSVSLLASPSAINNNEDVIVSWDGIENATPSDYVAIYCPANEGNDSDYLDMLYTNSSTASGSLRFEGLINMRCTYGFRYYQGTQVNGKFPLVATSNPVTMIEGITEVTQVHLSLTSDPSQMTVTWTTGSNIYESMVLYGLSPSNLSESESSIASDTLTYTADQMCGAPANITSQQTFRDPGYFHTVTLNNLKENTTYYYKCGNENESWSPVYWFKTSPSSTSYSDEETAAIPIDIIVYGDMGVNSPPSAVTTATRVTNEVFEGSSLVLHIGDLSYARGFGYIWEQFFNIVESVTAHVPYMINMGNHEYDHIEGGENDPSGAPGEGFHPSWGNYEDDSSGECSVPMYYRFSAPSNGHGIYWYSFDYGNTHIIMMSTEHNFTKGSDQYKWIESDLKQVNRARTPFIIFGGHRAMYESQEYASQWEVGIGLRQSFEDLLFQYKVDLAFWGHYHAYERTCPVYQGKCNVDGTTHIVVGTAGFYLTENPRVPRPWSAAFILDFGYCKVSSTRNTLTVQFVHNENGSIGDEIVLNSRF